MKILQVNCVYNEGSTGKITHDIHKELLSRGMESVVYYGRRSKTTEPGVHKICSEVYAKANNLRSRVTGLMYGGCELSTARLIRAIRKERPDVVHLQCINGYFVNIYRLLEWLKQNRIRTVLTLHAEFMYTANCGHARDCEKWKTGCGNCPRLKQETKSWFFDKTAVSWRRFQKIYENWDDLTVVCCSDWIRGRAARSGTLGKAQFRTIRNGIDHGSVFYPREDGAEAICREYKLPPEKKRILFVAPSFSELKGFDLLQNLMESCRDLPFHFLLVGDCWDSAPENATVIGPVRDQNLLARLYSGADALVMCSRCDTYPTVCLEAVCCGTPVAGFDVGGVKETIPDGMGAVVPLGDMEGMKQLLLELTAKRPEAQVVENARHRHSKARMVEDYLRLYRTLCGENRDQ